MKDNQEVKRLSDLTKARGPLLWINLITLYRTIAFPVLIVLIAIDRYDIFKWMLIVSFLTDAIDGFLARAYKINSVLGARMDSIGDDLTVLAGILGLVFGKPEFLLQNWLAIAIPLAFFAVQTVAALVQYGRISSFHTYLAKTAAVLQGFFLCSMFLFEEPAYWLFYSAVIVTTIELVEEIAIVFVLRQWQTNVHGLYWVLKGLRSNGNTN
ncbi:MAG: CDP-alcohol phosphatidyltransferase family protein [Cyclobacteriaceae bacterium]